MVILNADVSNDFLIDCLWGKIENKYLNEASSSGIDINIDIDADGVPFFMMDTGRTDIDVDFQTRELTDNKGVSVGWEFVPFIHTDEVDSEYNMDTEDDLVEKFNVWNVVLELCKQIYQIEFYPNDYIEEVEDL